MPHTNTSILEGYTSSATITFTEPLRTPCGSRITVVMVRVDVEYAIESGQIVVHRVALSQPKGGGLEGCNMVSKRTGETWHANWVGPEGPLAQVVQRDLLQGAPLGRLMVRHWRETHPEVEVPYIPEPFKFRMLNLPLDEQQSAEVNGRCEGCGKHATLIRIGTGQMICSDCLREIRSK